MPRLRPKVVRLLASTVLLAVVSLGYISTLDFHDHTPETVRLFGGQDGYNTVANPDKVEAFRVGPKEPPANALGNFTWVAANYKDVSGPVPVPKQTANELSAALTSSGSYWWHEGWFGVVGMKACATLYNVRLAFHRGTKRVDVYLCFGCDDLAVPQGTGKRVQEGGDQRVQESTRIRPALLRAAKQLFPGDPLIQKFK